MANENIRKEKALARLMRELNAGLRSAEKDGWISETEFLKNIHNKKNEVK